MQARHPLAYLAGFLLIFAALYSLYHLSEPLLPAYYQALASSTCWVFGWFDQAVGCEANYILYHGVRRLMVVEGCDGVTFFVLVLAAVLPFPAPWRHKLIGLAWMLPLIFIINWARLLVLTAIQFYATTYFDIFHVYFFQPLMIAFTLVFFMLWMLIADAKPV